MNVPPVDLFRAVQEGDVPQVQLLLDQGADVNAVSAIGSPGALTPLMLAALLGQVQIAQLLLGHGADPSTQTPSERGVCSRSVLAVAAVNGQVEIVGLLLGYGVEVNARNEVGLTAMAMAKRKAEQPYWQEQIRRVIALLEEAGAIE